MKKFGYFLLAYLFLSSILCGCGGSSKEKSGDGTTSSKNSANGVLEYNAPALPKIEAVDSVRLLENTEPVITENTKRVVLPDFDTDYQFHDGMLAIRNRQTNKWGFIDTEGNLVIDFLWHGESPRFNNGVAVVGKSGSQGVVQRIGTWYIINKNGDVVKEFPKEVSKVSQFTDGYAYVIENLNNKFYYINTQGKPIFDSYSCRYSSNGMRSANFNLRPFSDGLVALYNPAIQRWGFVDKTGNDIIPANFSEVGNFSEGLAAVRFPATETNASKWGYINKQGNVAIEPIFTNPVSEFSDGYAIATQTNKKQVYINKSGQKASPEYKQAYPFKNGTALVHQDNKNIGIIDKDFNFLADKLLTSETVHISPSGQDTIRDTYYYTNLDSPRIIYHGDNYFTLHHHNAGTLANSNLFSIDGLRHTRLSAQSHFSNQSTEYKIWNFYGNLAHVTYYSRGRQIGPLDGIIDFNKGLEFIILFEKSQF